MSKTAEHFNDIAGQYDYFKQRNWYYYHNLKKLYQEFIPKKSKVLDVGCGTGDILVALAPREGLGVDVSFAMIELAKAKHYQESKTRFLAGDLENNLGVVKSENWDFIILADVVEHLENPALYFKLLAQIARYNTKVMISCANPLWEPALLVLEKLKLKMPEGPHYRLPLRRIKQLAQENGFRVVKQGFRLLMPAPIPGVANFINRYFYRLPLLKNLGLTAFFIFQK